MRWALIVIACCTLAGCVISDGGATGTGGQSKAGQSFTGQNGLDTSPWLNPDAVVNRVERLTTPSGIDLREARYLHPPAGEGQIGGPEPLVLTRLRDYSNRREGQADRQYVVKLDTASGATNLVELAETVMPVAIRVEATREKWVLNALETPAGGELARAKAVIRVYQLDGEPRDLPLEDPLCAMGFSTDGAIIARPIKRTTLEGGLVNVVLDWGVNQRRFNEMTQDWHETTVSSFIQSHSGRRACGYRINHEPSLPGASLVSYHLSDPLSGRTTEQLVHTSQFYVIPSGVPWEPVLGWADESTLFAVDFLPGATGRGKTPNSRGIFRIVSLHPATGSVWLIEDHLAAGLPVVGGGGVIFYTRQAIDGEAQVWELWAASIDGMRKQRLWSVDGDTVMLVVEDILAGRRLLVNRQYVSLEGGAPQLLSQLTEFSLDELSSTKPAAMDIEPLQPFSGSSRGSGDSLSRFAMEEGEGITPPPITVPR